ncbi:hypothetical protein DYBT9275_01970 [Dyadobacter sp. CECT 9275]|uniref:Uncharacterized protein n=1 Tax=Dyadobacter helix TaxID=2822344 RepID=A0A916NBI7_9BACT|nr:hypothetical protein [Dyadobacter sp. CECT 9275]CAG4998289.1 hypothetical protein DYBT9275_01970 [Dyadobacter sp. CECT 9275]
MNKQKWFPLLITLCLIARLTHAQGVKRIELPLSGSDVAYQTILLGEKGVLLVSKPDRGSFNVQKFDTNLEKLWSIDGPVESNLDYIASSYDGQAVFLLFSKYRSSLYQIVKVNVGPGFVETFTINTIDRFEITDFKTLGYSVYMAGTVRNEPVLIHTDLTSSQTKILPSAIKGSNAIQTVEVDTLHRLVNVCFAVKKGRQTKIVARSYQENGELYTEVGVEPEDDFSLLNGRLQILNDSVRLVIGTYGYRNMQSSTNAASQGLYISKIVNDELVFTRYHSFTDFENFFDYMSDRQQEKMERKIRKKKEAGDDLKLNYRLLVHDLVPKNENFLLVAEVFYPEYRYQNPGMMGGLGYGYMMGYPFGMGLYNPYLWNPMYGGRGYNQQIFDGFTYTHAIVADIDQNGKLVWDNSISFDNVKSMELREKIRLQPEANGNTKLIYSHNGAIRSKIIKEGKVVDADRVIPNGTNIEGDKVRKTSTDDIDYWYGNFYLAWGEQRIVNAAGDPQTRGRRNVYYLNKISF